MKHYDLIVVGGGVAGVASAVCGARHGLHTLLIEKFGSLGGAMTNSLIYPFMRHAKDNGKVPLSAGIFTEMKERMKTYDDTSWECYRFVFDDMVNEAGVDVLFHATVFEAVTTDRRITSVRTATKSGVMEFSADFFVDASGDGELMAMAGCDCQLGRDSDGYCQPMTTCFRVAGVDRKAFAADHDRVQKLYTEYREAGKITNPRENILMFWGLGDGICHFNTTRVVKLNPVDPFEVSRAEMIARKQVYEMYTFMKNNAAGFEKSTIISIASHIGVRESRKLRGVHILTADELIGFTHFDDTIALGNYDIDIHSPTGTGTSFHFFGDGDCYEIPYRCLLPKEYDNMLVAGRCLSATHEAHSAVRIIPICACLGQAAGTAAALARDTGTNAHTLDVKELQKLLKADGAAL